MAVKVIIIVIVLLALGIVWYGFRERALLQNSSELFEQSQAFTRDFYVGKSTDMPITYVVMGDSIGFGTGVARIEDTYFYQVASSLATKGKYVHVVNVAQHGAKLHNFAEEQLPQVGGLNPAVITITIGANDATHFVGIKDVRNHVTEATRVLAALPDTHVYMATVPDLGFIQAFPKPVAMLMAFQAQKENDRMREITKDTKITIVDLYTDGKLKNLDLYASDKFHPNAKGYALWSDLFAKSMSDNK